MVRDNGCMYVAKIESSMLTHQLPCKYARLHLGSALLQTGQSQLLCAVAMCVSPAWPWQRWPQLMGKGHRAPGSSWKVEMCSKDTNTGLAGDNLGRGLQTCCCNTNSVNDIFPQYFPLNFWHMWHVCWTASFLEQAAPALAISKPQDYEGNYC